MALVVKNLPGNVWDVDQEDPLKEEMAAHSSIPAWKIPRTDDPGGLQSMGSQSDWATEHSVIISLPFSWSHEDAIEYIN